MLFSRAVFLIACSVGFQPLLGQLKQPATFSVKSDCELTQNIGGYYRINADLGSLPLDAIGSVKLHVHNSLNHDVEFGTVFSGCSCLQTTLSEKTLKAGGNLVIDLRLTTPKKSKSLQQFVPLTIGKSEATMAYGIDIRMSYVLQGMVAFADAAAVVNVVAGTKKVVFRAPLIVGEPVNPDDIRFQPTGALKNLETKLTVENNQYFAECSIDVEQLGDTGIAGELRVEDSRSGVADTLMCNLFLKPTVVISPNPMTLVWSAESGAFTSSALVQFNEPLAVSDDRGKMRAIASGKELQISATIDGAVVKSETKQLQKGLAKITLKIVPDDGPEAFQSKAESSQGIDMCVTVSGKDYHSKCRARFKR